MNATLSFDIGQNHFSRQLHLTQDKESLAGLGRRCVDYLRLAVEKPFHPSDAPGVLRKLLLPSRVPVEQSFILGIYARPQAVSGDVPPLVGVLYFLQPPLRCDTWFITLLLLAPSARGRGLGTAVHQAFECWAAARGASRLVVSVSDKNPRAWHFWHDRLSYQESDAFAWAHTSMGRKHRELEYRMKNTQTLAPWRI